MPFSFINWGVNGNLYNETIDKYAFFINEFGCGWIFIYWIIVSKAHEKYAFFRFQKKIDWDVVAQRFLQILWHCLHIHYILKCRIVFPWWNSLEAGNLLSWERKSDSLTDERQWRKMRNWISDPQYSGSDLIAISRRCIQMISRKDLK